MKIRLGLVDDHQLFRKSLIVLLHSIGPYEVIVDASHGLELIDKLKLAEIMPEIMLIDVEMPFMNGHETAQWLRSTHPDIKLIALSMNDQEPVVLKMIRAGCCSYLLKDSAPEELVRALQEVYYKNYYNSELSRSTLGQLMMANPGEHATTISDNEQVFLKQACTDLTYEQIAKAMKLSVRTIDGYREALFSKFHVQSRTGMVLEAIRRGIIKL